MSHIVEVLLDRKIYEAKAEVIEILETNKISPDAIPQSLVFDKAEYQDKATVLEWSANHGFPSDEIKETDNNYIIPIFDTSEFITETLRPLEIRPNIVMVVGILRPVESSETILFIDDEKETIKPLTSLRNLEGIKLEQQAPHIIELAKVISGVHPAYGKIEITTQILKSFEKNFRSGAVGIDISIDIEHDQGEAAGWVRDVFMSNDGQRLYGEIHWTSKGAKLLSNKAYRYFSPEYNLNWTHPHTGKSYGPTLLGGGLVNRPFLKMEAIVTLSELSKHKSKKKEPKMDTIALSEHQSKLAEKERIISEFKLSEEKSKTIMNNMNEENKKLSEEIKELKETQKKEKWIGEVETKFNKNEISEAAKKYLLDCGSKESVDAFKLMELNKELNTKPAGKDADPTKTTVTLSDEDEAYRMKHMPDISPEEFAKYNS